MFYNISRTLTILPYISYGLLGFAWLFMEIRNYRQQVGDSPTPEPSREGFIIPPGDGYEYYLSSKQIVYIMKKAANRYRIYVVRGENPNAKVRKDKFGSYFTARCPDFATAERIAETTFGMERK